MPQKRSDEPKMQGKYTPDMIDAAMNAAPVVQSSQRYEIDHAAMVDHEYLFLTIEPTRGKFGPAFYADVVKVGDPNRKVLRAFIGSEVVVQAIEERGLKCPFRATIVKVNRYYRLK